MQYHRQPSKRPAPKVKRRRTKPGLFEKPRIDPALKHHFNQIGVPESSPFIPDPFQVEAIEKIQETDVLVSAPTGAGKTWIASEVIGQYLNTGKKVWYASPLKALSNSLYLEFSREFGRDQCGILTGERKENIGAPVIVGTTEILRNQLYDAMHEGIDVEADIVIIDEAHYLSDPDRGVVWEEVLIYLPARIRLLLLSATISNAEEVCAWLSRNRNIDANVVRSDERPVPMKSLFLFPDGLISPLTSKRGLTPKVKKYISSQTNRRRFRGQKRTRYNEIIDCLREFNLLPAIFFLKSRSDCDSALEQCDRSKNKKSIEQIKSEVKLFIKEYPHLRGHRQMRFLTDCRVASHHAGQLPYWKVLIEKIMNKGLLEVIFSTSTVAAGVNFPARTVVLFQSDRFNGHEFTDLTSTELHQMIGRAGRRGKDNIGFALIIPGSFQDPQLISELLKSPPEPIVSRICINFSMTLNLLLSHSPLEVKKLLDLSFAAFQQKRMNFVMSRQWERIAGLIQKTVPHGLCDTSDPFEIVENMTKWAEQKRKPSRLQNGNIDEISGYLKKGSLFQVENGRIYLLFRTFTDHGRKMCLAQDIGKKVRSLKGKIKLKKVSANKISRVFDLRIDLPQEPRLESLQNIIDGIEPEKLKNIQTYENGIHERDRETEIRTDLVCEECEHINVCHGSVPRDLKRALKEFNSLSDRIEGIGEGLWISFKRHLRFLKETGFVDFEDKLTTDGIWASKLRLDQPLLIAEAIRKGGFKDMAPELLAGCIAHFVWDRDQEIEVKEVDYKDIELVEEASQKITDSIGSMRDLMDRRAFVNPAIPFWPARALFMWARGVEWDMLIDGFRVGEGDMASMIVRTADHLRQVVNLKDSHPVLSETASRAISLILREPVFIE